MAAIAHTRTPARPGTARSALQHRAFRTVWACTMASNVGTWMQNVALGALAYKMTRSESFLALIGFVQLGPILVLATVGGLLADRFDRRTLLVITNTEQMIFSVVLGLVVLHGTPPRLSLLLVVLAIGVGNALSGPSFSSYLPRLVPRADLGGAVSLFSVQMNLSRVIGPALGGLLLPSLGFSGIFFVNAATYLFAVAGVLTGPASKVAPTGEAGFKRLFGGFAVARRDPLVRSVLLSITAFSFVCLPFIGLIPALAEKNLGIDVKSVQYGLLYACFGLGAAIGAMGVGSWFVEVHPQRLLRRSLLLFAVLLGAWALLRAPVPAYAVVLVLGAAYFTTSTVLSTTLQRHLDDAVRGRVLALYMMGFGGTVPLGLLVFGNLSRVIGMTPVLLIGALGALVMTVVVRLDPDDVPGGLMSRAGEPESEEVSL
jgi:MFS family permease